MIYLKVVQNSTTANPSSASTRAPRTADQSTASSTPAEPSSSQRSRPHIAPPYPSEEEKGEHEYWDRRPHSQHAKHLEQGVPYLKPHPVAMRFAAYRALEWSPQDNSTARRMKIDAQDDFIREINNQQAATVRAVVKEAKKPDKHFTKRWQKANNSLRLAENGEEIYNWSQLQLDPRLNADDLMSLAEDDTTNILRTGVTSAQYQRAMRANGDQPISKLQNHLYRRVGWREVECVDHLSAANTNKKRNKWPFQKMLQWQMIDLLKLTPMREEIGSIFDTFTERTAREGKTEHLSYIPPHTLPLLFQASRKYIAFLLRSIDTLLQVAQLEQPLLEPKPSVQRLFLLKNFVASTVHNQHERWFKLLDKNKLARPLHEVKDAVFWHIAKIPSLSANIKTWGRQCSDGQPTRTEVLGQNLASRKRTRDFPRAPPRHTKRLKRENAAGLTDPKSGKTPKHCSFCNKIAFHSPSRCWNNPNSSAFNPSKGKGKKGKGNKNKGKGNKNSTSAVKQE